MVDIHCHILPDFDDGAGDLDEALNMAQMAVVSGVTDIIATPHFQGNEQMLEQVSVINRQFQLLSAALERANIPLRLHPGAEVLCVAETAALAASHQLPTLAQTDYVLTEFYFDESFSFMDDLLRRIADSGYHPVIAHPERYQAIQRDPGLVQRWADLGYVIQLNKGSVLGAFGSHAEQTANRILAMGIAHVIASDAHSCRSRTPHMGALRQWLSEMCEPEYAAILLEKNPSRVLHGRPMVGMEA